MNGIQIKDLSVSYGEQSALKQISFDIPQQSITALIGPSGCGKSTLLRTLNRMNDDTPGIQISGEIYIAGAPIYAKEVRVEKLRRYTGMVFQAPNPFPTSIYDNVAYGPRLYGITRKKDLDEVVERSLRAAALWEEVADKLKSHAFGLSGGQQQRLCIARALAVDPKVLLMDESTAALDPFSTQKIEELAKELSKLYTIVMVTHNLAQAARVSDQTAFLLNGELIEYGPTIQIFSKPNQGQTENYVAGRFG